MMKATLLIPPISTALAFAASVGIEIDLSHYV
jgi:hypothetical protein